MRKGVKNGKIVPANDLTPPRTVLNFAPGPTVVYTREGKTVKIPAREAERGFRMSQESDFVPRAPQIHLKENQRLFAEALV